MKADAWLGSLILVGLVLAACATPGGRSAAPPTGVSCLLDPAERGTRPLVLLFCYESP